MFETFLATIHEAKAALAEAPSDLSDAQLVDVIREAEELKCSAAAAQAAAAVRLDESQRAAQVEAGLRPERVGEGVAEQVGRPAASQRARAPGCSASPRSSSGRCRTRWR
ncbi:MAG: endonuclease [Nocardioides sp.]|nr:endonuclease [Nocardioides sp.]